MEDKRQKERKYGKSALSPKQIIKITLNVIYRELRRCQNESAVVKRVDYILADTQRLKLRYKPYMRGFIHSVKRRRKIIKEDIKIYESFNVSIKRNL